jgi:hypothetical protein
MKHDIGHCRVIFSISGSGDAPDEEGIELSNRMAARKLSKRARGGPPGGQSEAVRWSLTMTLECRGNFCKRDMPLKDATGWLGREDSNLRMAESKIARAR